MPSTTQPLSTCISGLCVGGPYDGKFHTLHHKCTVFHVEEQTPYPGLSPEPPLHQIPHHADMKHLPSYKS